MRCPYFLFQGRYQNVSKRQIIRRTLKSTPPIMSGVVSGIHPEGYLTMA